MVGRILSSALAAAWVATASPALAYYPSDPTGPSPDDPAAWTERAPARALAREKGDDDCRCAMDVRGNAASSSEEEAKRHDMETHRAEDVDRG
jgi:hypothetical protein